MFRTLVVLAILGCGSNAPEHPPAQIVDLTTSTDALLRDFDAHASEARFVTIVAPS